MTTVPSSEEQHTLVATQHTQGKEHMHYIVAVDWLLLKETV